jgi:hypothetical protein
LLPASFTNEAIAPLVTVKRPWSETPAGYAEIPDTTEHPVQEGAVPEE